MLSFAVTFYHLLLFTIIGLPAGKVAMLQCNYEKSRKDEDIGNEDDEEAFDDDDDYDDKEEDTGDVNYKYNNIYNEQKSLDELSLW